MQERTESIMRKVSESSHSPKNIFKKKKTLVVDRRHRITAQIDSIRQEQVTRLAEKAAEKRRIQDNAIKKCSYSRIRKMSIHPKSTWKQLWDLMILSFVLFSSAQIPLLLAFPDMPEIGPIQYVIDALFIADFFMCFRTGYIRADNEVEMDQAKIIHNYLRSWFAIDFAACFPLDIFIPQDGTDVGENKVRVMLRLLKLPRLLRLGRLLKFLQRFKYAGAMKIAKFIFMFVLIAHWTGCIFFFIMNLENEYGYGTWMEENTGLIVQGEGISSRYVTMLYTALLMLIGEGMDMETDSEKLFGAMVVVLGTFVVAVIVGNVSFVVSNQNSTSYQYQSKIDMITDEMRALHLPGELQHRVLAYYEYMWNRHRTFDPACVRFTSDLSPTLRKEILLHMNRECVLNCDFFREVSNECIIKLVHSFKFAVFLAHDVIAEEGEQAAEMVFIIHGSAKVTKKNRAMPLSMLESGDYFGEKSLLMHHRNAVSIIAIDNCDTRVLEKVSASCLFDVKCLDAILHTCYFN